MTSRSFTLTTGRAQALIAQLCAHFGKQATCIHLRVYNVCVCMCIDHTADYSAPLEETKQIVYA